MPIYEFKCQNCHKNFDELIRNTSEMDAVHCPYCDDVQVSRMMSMFGFSSGTTSTLSNTGSSCSSCGSKNCASCR